MAALLLWVTRDWQMLVYWFCQKASILYIYFKFLFQNLYATKWEMFCLQDVYYFKKYYCIILKTPSSCLPWEMWLCAFLLFLSFFFLHSFLNCPQEVSENGPEFLRKPWLRRGYIKRPAPKRKTGLNPFIFDNRAAKHAGVCGTRTLHVWISKQTRASRRCDPQGVRKRAFTAEWALTGLSRGPPQRVLATEGSASGPHWSVPAPLLVSAQIHCGCQQLRSSGCRHQTKVCLPRSPLFAEQVQENVYHKLPNSIVHMFKMLSKKINKQTKCQVNAKISESPDIISLKIDLNELNAGFSTCKALWYTIEDSPVPHRLWIVQQNQTTLSSLVYQVFLDRFAVSAI